jgi:protein-disulfide isomerase
MVPNIRRAALLALPMFLVACGDASSKSGDKAAVATSAAHAKENVIQASDMVMGSKDARVTIVEYASVTCPHCATFHTEILPSIKEEYIATGKVNLVFREFPTPPQVLATVGSMLARCAAEKGGSDAYFLVTSTLFKTQQTWVGASDPKTELQKIAAQAGMDSAAFEACIKRQDLLDMMNARVEEGSNKLGVNSTPSFFINGERLPPLDAEGFAKRLDEELAKAKN